MTTDIAALKAAALACDPSKCSDEAEHERRLGEFFSECEPEDVLGLIAEIEQLKEGEKIADELCAQLSGLLDQAATTLRGPAAPGKRHGFADIPSRVKTVVAALDQLKAENARLRPIFDAVVSETANGRYIRPGNSPWHDHTVPGVWDRGQSGLAGKECGWCKAWNLAQTIAKDSSHDA